ncbi:MAG: CRISPR-associated protein Cas4 [Methanobrevibacter millerae]|uniref:CRISPR-associated exonuclease Cas4 n=1 Tax=Methanobrevibacter millerae TaxID=230361 RepID=A0A8T3VD15_9EURY|nr:CRISPR-associated protein Cas4 [Methanobrevibacter millerae]MBE6504305.1 CRISPR-associated protein Cas4 [Methanobrevibacter millerae]
MENKLIKYKMYSFKKHPSIESIQIIEGKNNFPISWLNQQGYCEYQIYLQYMKGIKTPESKAMKKGTDVHNQLEEKFLESAEPATFEEVLEISKEESTLTRECFVISPDDGIRGFIDEIWMTPTEIIIIDDKPGSKAFPSTINQVRAYCLAFKKMSNDERPIKGALRQRGTENIFWIEEFDKDREKEILFTINRMHSLFDGQKPFMATKNPNKCKSCRYNDCCEESKVLK